MPVCASARAVVDARATATVDALDAATDPFDAVTDASTLSPPTLVLVDEHVEDVREPF